MDEESERWILAEELRKLAFKLTESLSAEQLAEIMDDSFKIPSIKQAKISDS